MGKEAGKAKLTARILLLFPLGIMALGLMLFLPAGSLGYWQAWLFIGALFVPVIFVVLYFLKHDPKLLERRMRFKEKESKERLIIKIASSLFFVGFLVSGFDHRYGWSSVPTWLVLVSDVVFFLAYVLIFFVFRENSYTSRIIEVEKGQKVITTGPYSVIRHPMYAGVILMCLSMPLALGSYWSLVLFVPAVAVIILRALDEEKVLLRGLKGYREYFKRVKYRIMPGVW